jgi:hypothetical protein
VSSRPSAKDVLKFLGVDDTELLPELRREGLFEAEELSPEEAEELRMAATLIRELGVNPAGVGVILHMRRRLLFLEERMRETLRRLLDDVENR